MNKYNYKYIKWLTDSEWSEDVRKAFGDVQPHGAEVGWYSPSQANWSYIVMITAISGKYYEVVTRFGSIEGGREIDLKHFDQWNTERLKNKG